MVKLREAEIANQQKTIDNQLYDDVVSFSTYPLRVCDPEIFSG